MFNNQRTKLFVDVKVQRPFLLRMVAYWFIYLITAGLVLGCWTLATRPTVSLFLPLDDVWFQFGPTFVVSLLMLPIALFDCARLTNRLAGPMYRMRQTMRSLMRGEPVQPIRLRDDDFWRGFAEEFNQVLARIEELEKRLERARLMSRGNQTGMSSRPSGSASRAKRRQHSLKPRQCKSV